MQREERDRIRVQACLPAVDSTGTLHQYGRDGQAVCVLSVLSKERHCVWG